MNLTFQDLFASVNGWTNSPGHATFTADMSVLVVILAAMLTIITVIWTHFQRQTAINRLDDRVTHLMAGLSLLTDTTEGALRDVALEIGRLAAMTEGAGGRTRGETRRRINGAARRGRSVQDIAASEGVSEGEVRLELQMKKAREEQMYAAVR